MTEAMAWTGVLTLFALLLSIQRNMGDYAYLGDTVTLTASEECETLKLIRRLKDDSPLTLATSVDDVWMPHEVYKDRIEHRSKLSVALTRVNYNDNGLYEFTCGSRVVTTIQLKVFIMTLISATEGEQVKLPCYSNTAGEQAEVGWEKDGELAVEQDQSSEEIRYGTSFKGINVSLSPNWYLNGDLSLTFWRVQPEDEGVYVCYTGGPQRTRGDPAAVRLKITTKRNPGQITRAPQIVPTSQSVPQQKEMQNWEIFGKIAAGVLVFVALTLLILFGWSLKSRCSSPGPGGERYSDVSTGPPPPPPPPPQANGCSSSNDAHAESTV